MRSLACILLILPTLLTAQAPERRAFALLTGSGDTVMVERWVRSGDRTEALLTMHGRPWYRFLAESDPESGTRRLVTTAYSPARPATAPPTSSREIVITDDSAVVRDAVGGDVLAAFPVARGTSPLFPASLALLQRLVRRAEREGDIWYNGQFTSPVLVVGAEGPVVDTIAFYARGVDSMRAYVARQQVDLALDDDGLIAGAMPSSAWLGLRYVRLPDAEADAPWPSEAVDYAPPSDAPYMVEDVRLVLRSGPALGGSLTLPIGRDGPVPAVLFLSGSGAQDRDGRMMSGYRPFRELADALARAGIASLRLDDRGIGASGGRYQGFTLEALVTDARIAWQWLAGRPEVDPARLALVGHSEGALVAMQVARSEAVDAMVIAGAPASRGREVVAWQQRYGAARLVRDSADARREELVDSLTREAARAIDVLAAESAGLRELLRHDPVREARRLRVPTLVLDGTTDRQIPPGDAARLAAALRHRGAPVDRLELPGVNHLLLADPVGDPGLYFTVPDRRLAPGVTRAIAAWLTDRWF
jgi:alpha-beta hydrolase superfamily lysophospholipase